MHVIQTTTLSILTAEFPPSDGEVRLGGYDISQNPDVVRRLVGYCPQFDALVSQPSRLRERTPSVCLLSGRQA